MKRILSSMADIRKGEALITLLMVAFYYVVLLTYYLLKPARDSIFLVERGAGQLPIVFILTALVIAPVTTLYSTASRSLRLTHLVYATSVVFVGSLAILRWLLTLETAWVFYLFYVWVSVFGALTASQYWLFANAVFTPAQGKRLFVLVNVGGILGAMTGGEVTRVLVETFGLPTEDLLFVCMAVIALFAVFARAVWRLHLRDDEQAAARKKVTAKKERRESLRQMVGMIKASRHLTYLVGIIALTMTTASFVDYQFKTISVQSFPEKEQLTSFLGVFYGRLSLVSLVLQVVFAYRVVRLVGVAGIVMFLPVALVLGSAFLLLVPGLLAATLLRGADGAFMYSLDKTGRELLFLPVPLEVKKRTKVFIDVFVDRWFRGAAGVALLVLTGVLGFTARGLGVVVIALSVAWLVLVVLIRKEYVDAFRNALARREIDPGQLTVNIADAATVQLLRDHLGSQNEREVVYALDMLSGAGDRALAQDLGGLLSHPSDEVRRRALEHLHRLGVTPEEGALSPLVHGDDPDVRVAALRFAATLDSGGTDALRGYLDDPDARVAASALRSAAAHESAEYRALVTRGRVEALLSVSGARAAEVRVEVARALGTLAAPLYNDVLVRLTQDDDDRVAGEAILAMGATRDPDFVPALLGAVAHVRRRQHARAALAEYGNAVVVKLGDCLGDASVDMAIRRHLPVVLSRIPTQQSADALSSNLGNADVSLRFRIVKALNTLRRQYPDLEIAEDRVDAAFVEETRAYYEILIARTLHRGGGAGPAEKLLSRALRERLDHNLERVFRLLGLRYPADDIYNAYLGTVSARREQRASAVELLDNVLGAKLKKYLIPIIDPASEGGTIERGRELFGLDVETREQSLLLLMRGRDAWLRACAVFCAGGDASPEVRRAVEDARRDADPVVAETAELVLSMA